MVVLIECQDEEGRLLHEYHFVCPRTIIICLLLVIIIITIITIITLSIVIITTIITIITTTIIIVITTIIIIVVSITLSVACRLSQSENFDSTSKRPKLGRGVEGNTNFVLYQNSNDFGLLQFHKKIPSRKNGIG